MREIIWPMPPVTSCYLENSEEKQVPFDTVFTAEFYGKLCVLMQIEETAATLTQLRLAHATAVSFLNHAEFEQKHAKTLSQENKMLEKIATNAESLTLLLAGMPSTPAASRRLEQEIRLNPTAYKGGKNASLSGLLDARRDHPFFTLQQLLSDLWASAQRAQIVNSDLKKNDLSCVLDNESCSDQSLIPPRLEPTVTLDNYNVRYRTKSAPLIAFITELAETWKRLSAVSYGPGMHLRETKTTKSAAVDAVMLSMKYQHVLKSKNSKPYTRPQVITAFRIWVERGSPSSQILNEYQT